MLTIDLLRGHDDLWNRNLGVQVEGPALHGTFQDVIDECADLGLEMFRQESVRDWGLTNVDIGLLAMRRVDNTQSRRRIVAGRRPRSWVGRLRA